MADESKILQELTKSSRFTLPLRLESICGGTINHSFCLHSASQRFFLKRFRGGELVACDRQANFELQARLAQSGLAPQPVYLANQRNFQVECWVTPQLLSHSDVCQGEIAERLAFALYRVHSSNINARSLNLELCWQHYIKRSKQAAPDIHSSIRRWADVLTNDDPAERVLCHNDLSLQHVSRAPHDPLFDWEYAATGSRFFDIASCIVVNRLQGDVKARMLARYSELCALDESHVRMKSEQYIPIVDFTNQLWHQALGDLK